MNGKPAARLAGGPWVVAVALSVGLGGLLGCSSEPDDAPATSFSVEASVPPNAVTPERTDPAAAPPDVDHASVRAAFHAELIDRIDGLEGALETLAATLEGAMSTWAAARPPVPEDSAALAPEIAALQAGQQRLAEVLGHVEARLAPPEPARTPVAAKPRPKAPVPPFVLAAVETWDGAAQAVLDLGGRRITAHVGETHAGWRITSIQYPDHIRVVHGRTGRTRDLTCHG